SINICPSASIPAIIRSMLLYCPTMMVDKVAFICSTARLSPLRSVRCSNISSSIYLTGLVINLFNQFVQFNQFGIGYLLLYAYISYIIYQVVGGIAGNSQL